MNQVSQFFLIPVVQAALWLIGGLAAGALVRALVVGVVHRSGLRERLTRDATSTQEAEKSYGSTIGYIGQLTFLLVFLMFVPAIFDSLGVTSVSGPVVQMLNAIWGFLPNVLAAAIVLGVGLTAARLVRQLLVPVFGRLRIDRLQERAGIATGTNARLSETLAYVVYVAIVVPVIIVALQVLNISAISDPATNMLNTIVGFVPNLIAASVVMMLGVFVGRMAGNVVGGLVASTGIDARAGELMDSRMPGTSVSRIANYVVQTIVVLFFAVEAFDILQLAVFANAGSALVAYLPNVLAAGVVAAAAAFATGVVGKALRGGSGARYAPVAQGAIWALAGIMVLSQLDIAGEIVQTGFVMVLGAMAVAFALAFGLGGRDFAKRTLDDMAPQDDMADVTRINRAA